MHLHAIKNNCAHNSPNYTWLHLVQLLDCYSYNYSLMTRKYMRLSIQIYQCSKIVSVGTFLRAPLLCVNTVVVAFLECAHVNSTFHGHKLLPLV